MKHSHPFRLVWLALLMMAALSVPSALAAPGDLDAAFGSGGKVVTSFGRLTEEGHAVAVQPDGRIVVGGFASAGTLDFAIARYLSDGQLDPSFGDGGKVLSSFPGEMAGVNALARQPDGRIVAVGTTFSNKFALARYLPDGTLDPSFGNGGLVLTSLGDFAYATSVALQADGRIVVAGNVVTRLTPQGYDNDILVVRYTPTGALDETFGTGGRATINVTIGDYANSVAIDAAGRIVTAGWVSSYPAPWADFAVARLEPDGTPDPGFGDAGVARADFTELGASYIDVANALAIQLDGKIVAGGTSSPMGAGTTGPRFALARFNEDGRLDSAFGTGGRVTTIFPAGQYRDNKIYALVADPTGRIVAAGASVDTSIYWAPMGDFALTRYEPDGTLDPTFGVDGRVLTDFGANDTARALARQADGNLVVAGITSASSSGGRTAFAIARYLGTIPDTTPPTISASATARGNAYTAGTWTNTDVVVHFACTDTDSGVASVTPDQTVSSEGGGQSVTGTCTDKAGNSASTTFSNIQIDKTPPRVSPSLIPTPGRDDNDKSDYIVQWTCTDALSGLASQTAALDGISVTNGQAVQLQYRDATTVDWKPKNDVLVIKANTFVLSVSCTDAVGNTGNGSFTLPTRDEDDQ